MGRNALTRYSLFSEIPSRLKLELIKLCVDKSPILDRSIGAVIGMGIGDATGAPLEFIPCVDEYKKSFFSLTPQNNDGRRYVREQNAFRLKRGQWTDDASMGLCMADSLILHKGYDGSDIRVRFWNWWNAGYCNAFRLDTDNQSGSSVGLGGNISKSIYSMAHGQKPSPRFMARGNDSGNGSLMRLAPIPVFFSHFQGDEELLNIALRHAKESNFTTHPGHIAAEACALMSFVIIRAIHRPNGKFENVREFLDTVTGEYLERLEKENTSSKMRLHEISQTKEFAQLKAKLEQANYQNVYGHETPSELQIAVGELHSQIMAQCFVIRLLRSAESDDSTERCWNWKCRYGELGIDLTMRNRGSRYNGYPNTQGYFGSYCMDGLAMGLHSVYNSKSFGDAVEKAVNMLGDADSTGSIAGQMAGAWYGFKSVFYDVDGEQFLWRQLARWSDYEFGVRAVLLTVMGKDAAEKYKAQRGKDKEKKAEQ